MADKNKMNEIVYYTNTGKKYHFNPKCSYIKNKKSYKIVLGEAIKIFEGPCYRCNRNDTYKSKTSNFGINNNSISQAPIHIINERKKSLVINKNSINYYSNIIEESLNQIELKEENRKKEIKIKKNKSSINLLTKNLKFLLKMEIKT